MSTLIQQKRYLLRLICLILWSILRGSFLYAQTDSVKILLNQAEQFIKMDSLDKGIRIAHLAFDKANTEGSVWGAGEAMRIIGSAYRQNDKPAKADEYLTKAVRIFEKTTFYERHARCLALLGRVKQGQRNFAEATELYTQSLAIYNQKLSPEEMVLYRDLKAFILERMTVILSNQKQYDQAETYATEAYNLCEQVGDKGRWEITATAVGNVYFWKKNYEKAAFYYQKAYELAKDIGRNTGRTLNNLGIVASKAGQLDKAIDYYTEAIEQYQKIGGTDMIAQTQINIAELNNDKGNYDRAIKLATLGTQTIAKSKTITGLTEGYEVLLTAYIKSNDLPRALDVQRQYSFLKDSLSNSSRKKEMLEAQVKFETERKDKEIQLLSKEKLLSDLQLQQKNFDLINQKLAGCQRLIWLAMTLISLFAGIIFLASSTELTAWLRLPLTIITAWVYFHLTMWVAMAVSLRMRVQTQATITILAIIVAWVALPLLVVSLIGDLTHQNLKEVCWLDLLSPLSAIIDDGKYAKHYEGRPSQSFSMWLNRMVLNLCWYGGIWWLVRRHCLKHADALLGRAC